MSMMLAALWLGGCTANGDFGRVRPSLVSDDIHSWMGPRAAEAYGERGSAYQLTDDERTVRDLAFPLIQPPYERQQWDSVVGEYGLKGASPRDARAIDRRAYWDGLMAFPTRSATTHYTKLIEDIRNDIVRIEPFTTVARRVLDMDDKRQKSLAYISGLSESERDNALARVRENALIIAWVQRTVKARIAAYRYALERLVVGTPSPLAVDAERSLTLLQTNAAESRLVSSPLFGSEPATHLDVGQRPDIVISARD